MDATCQLSPRYGFARKFEKAGSSADFRGYDGGCERQDEAVYQNILAKIVPSIWLHNSPLHTRHHTVYGCEAWFHLSGYGTSDMHYRQLAMPHPDTPGVTSEHDMSLCSTRNKVKSYQRYPIVFSSVRDLGLNILVSSYTGF